MSQVVYQLAELPEAPLDAAAHFLAEHMPFVRELLKGEAELPGFDGELDALALVFPSGGKDQHGWRLAVVQELARRSAPLRVNGIEGNDEAAIDEAADWLAAARASQASLTVQASNAGNSGI